MKHPFMIKKILIISFFLAVLLVSATVSFIEFDTSAAADLTDNVLRPMFGDNNIIFLEKIFFNTSDTIQQITSKGSTPQSPQFNDATQSGTNIQGSNLELGTIPTNTHFPPLQNEGTWQINPLSVFPNDEVMAHTFVRPDPDRPYAIVSIVQMDMKKLSLGAVAGIKEPAGKVGHSGPGKVPKEIVQNNNLVAAFDGGFQYKDGAYGMIVGNTTYLPLQNNLGTVVGYTDGTIKIIDYTGQDFGKNVAFVRQNCPILLEDGQLGIENEKNKKLWGRTFTSDIYTWRTGIGITKQGNLLFAVGNSLTPTTLATALKMAGAENAIQLDINPNWVRFNIFNSLGNGQYDSQPLTKDLKNGTIAFLSGYAKDFFYVYKK